MNFKLIFALVAMGLALNFLVEGAGALIDHPISSQRVHKSERTQPADADLTAEQAAILAGADPTKILEVTGAGGAQDLPSVSADCSTGSLEVDDSQWSNLNGTAYVSSVYEGNRYVQTLSFPPTFFVQDQHRRVTATLIDKLPEAVLVAMEKQLAELNRCESKPLFIARFSQ